MNRTTSTTADVPLETIFVGREHELAELQAKLSTASTGQGQLALVAGEPGIGKTRLATVFSDYARQHEALVLWGRVMGRLPFGRGYKSCVPMGNSMRRTCWLRQWAQALLISRKSFPASGTH